MRKAQFDEQKVILVVEDSPVQALALTKLLEQNGLGVLCASNGLSGFAMARSYQPDLVLLDVQMPEMNGLETCACLQSDPTTSSIPVILFTAHTELDLMRAGFAQGAVDFIPKDAFSNQVLIETLHQLHILGNDSEGPNDATGEDSAGIRK